MARVGRPPLVPQHDFAGIYQVINLVNGKRYVGQAQNVRMRLLEHRKGRNGSADGFNPFSRLYRAVAKYGWQSFECSLLERVDDLRDLDERETFWIETLRTYDPEHGYNICREPSTTRGWQHRDSSRAKMRGAAQSRNGERNGFYGKRHSDETKARIGAINGARIRTEAEKAKLKAARALSGSGKPARPVNQIDPATGTVAGRWTTISAAAQTLGIDLGSLIGCCRGRRKTAGGWIWRYTES